MLTKRGEIQERLEGLLIERGFTRRAVNKAWKGAPNGAVKRVLKLKKDPDEQDRAIRSFAEWLQYGIEQRQAGQRDRIDTVPIPDCLLTTEERDRIAELEEDLRRQFEGEPLLWDFRKRVLGGRNVTPGEAAAFLGSHSLRFVPLEELRAAGVDLLNHGAKVTSRRTMHDREERIMRLRHPEIVRIEPGGIEFSPPVPSGPGYYESSAPRFGPYPSCLPGSAMHYLLVVAGPLPDRFGWTQEEAERAVLTGELPPLVVVDVQITFRTYPHWRETRFIQIRAEDWISAESVGRIHKHFQSQLDDAERLGSGDALLRFFQDRPDLGPSSARALVEWNDAHPERPFTDRVSLYKARKAAIRRRDGPEATEAGKRGWRVPPKPWKRL